MATKQPTIPLSTKPWSDYTAADYTPEQWHKACLIHNHEGSVPESKQLCKLPIRTPDGTVNRNGLFAAAAALAGARGGVNATAEQKNSAATTLLRIYKQIGQTPPHSLYVKHSEVDDLEDFLDHHGIKGMRWGVRRSRTESSSQRQSGDFKRAQELRRRNPASLTNKQLKTLNERLNLERQHRQLNPGLVHSGKARVEFILGTAGLGVTAYKLVKSDAFKALLNLGKKRTNIQLKLPFKG